MKCLFVRDNKYTWKVPLNESHFDDFKLRVFNEVRQWEEVKWASQLQPSGQTDLLCCYAKTWVNAD